MLVRKCDFFDKMNRSTCMKTVNCTSTQYFEVPIHNNLTQTSQHQTLSSRSTAPHVGSV